MSEISRILDQLHREFEGRAWHGDNVSDTLKGITAEQAVRKPISAAHSIWELTVHMAFWKQAVTARLVGNPLTITDDMDWRPITDTSSAAWKTAVDNLCAAHQALVTAVAKFDESRLDEQVGPDNSTCYVLIHGIIQHDLYHAGQIAILKKSFVS